MPGEYIFAAQQLPTVPMLKIITILNWIVIGILALLVAAETLFPTKGGDAAGRGMGQAIYYLAIIALVVLLILNLLPYNWSKYAAFGLILLPLFLIKFDSALIGVKKWLNRTPEGRNQDGTPWFRDEQKQRLALAIYNGDVEQVKKLLQEPVPQLNETSGEEPSLLGFAVSETASASYREAEKLDCVKLLFAAGARPQPSDAGGNPIHLAPATAGNSALLKLLLGHGADPNARDIYFHRPVLFEAIASYKAPKETVQALLDAGADPNATTVDGDRGPVSALIYAAERERWNLCLLLLAKKADAGFQTSDGTTLKKLVQQADASYTGDGYSTRADFDQLKKALQQ